jgi:hypothetical protein
MKKISLFLMTFFSITGSLLAKSDVPAARWRTHQLVIDGKDKDWEKPINLYNNETGMFFAISNDSTTLYLNFTVTDPQKMIKIMNAGWSVDFSTKNKETKTKASMVFPATKGDGIKNKMGAPGSKMNANTYGNRSAGKPDNRSQDEENPNIPDPRIIKNYIHDLNSFVATDFIFTHGEVSLKDTTGIRVCVGQSDPMGLLYEIAIPLNDLYEEDSVQLNELINMTVSVNGMALPEGGAGNKPQGEMRSGGGPGGGGPGGGGPGGGGPGGGRMSSENSGPTNTVSENVTFKQKFVLVSK